jgi:hypothetical protein
MMAFSLFSWYSHTERIMMMEARKVLLFEMTIIYDAAPVFKLMTF